MSDFRPEMNVVRFGAEDTIATSGVVLSNFGDYNKDNNTFSFGGNNYNLSGGGYNNFRSDLSNYVGDPGLANMTSNQIYFGEYTVANLNQGTGLTDADGEYTYNGAGTWSFTKKQ